MSDGRNAELGVGGGDSRTIFPGVINRRPQTTPIEFNGTVRAFLREIGLPKDAFYLPFAPLDDRYRATYCLDNCAHAEREGLGVAVYGWIIWEARKHRFIEAEFHSVLRQGDELMDITPRPDGEEKILFVPDPARIPVFGPRGWTTYSNFISRNRVLEASRASIRGFDAALRQPVSG